MKDGFALVYIKDGYQHNVVLSEEELKILQCVVALVIEGDDIVLEEKCRRVKKVGYKNEK